MNVGNVIYHYELALERAETIVAALRSVGYLSRRQWFVYDLDFHPQTEVRILIEENSCWDTNRDSISRVPARLWEDADLIMPWARQWRAEQLEREREREEHDRIQAEALFEANERAQLEALLKKYPQPKGN